MGNQVGEETLCVRFGAGPCTVLFGGDMPILAIILFIYAFFFKQPTGQTRGRILTHDTSKYAKLRKAKTFGVIIISINI